MSKLVFIYSVDRDSVLGLEGIKSEGGNRIRKNKIGGTHNVYDVLYSSKVGGLATGLYYPWTEKGENLKDEKGDTLTLQDKYEKQYNLPKGYLSNIALREWESVTIPEEKKTFYQKFSYILNDGATVLNLDKMEDLLTYHILLEAPHVANSERELKQFKWPKAEYYIALEDESEELKYSKSIKLDKAIGALVDPNLTPITKQKIAVVLKVVNVRSALKEEALHNVLSAHLKLNDANIDRFMTLYQKTQNAKGKEELEAEYQLQRMMDYNIVMEKQGAYYFYKGTETVTVGENRTEAIAFFANSKKVPVIEEMNALIPDK